MIKKIGYNIVYVVAVILEWVNIPLFLAAMGYEINILEKLREIYYISQIYYTTAAIDILLYMILSFISRKKKRLKATVIFTISCLIQIILLIYKIKL